MSFELFHNSSKRNIVNSEVKSVWWRRPLPVVFPRSFSDMEAQFAGNEYAAYLIGIWNTLNCYWMSFPARIREASNKIEQLQRARRFGFEIPRTLITTDVESVRQFRHELKAFGKEMIYKVLSTPTLRPPHAQMTFESSEAVSALEMNTTIINEDQLENIDSVKYTPCLFQEYIPKLYELRVTIIGDSFFIAKIDSQSNSKTSVDWRDYSVDIPFTPIQVPDEFRNRCYEFVKSYNLNYSALDFIVTKDGRYIFIENNPNGQFLFIEELIPEFKMKSALANCLISARSL